MFYGSGLSLNFNVIDWRGFINKLLKDLECFISNEEISDESISLLNDLKSLKTRLNNKQIDIIYALDWLYYFLKINKDGLDNIKYYKIVKKSYLKYFKFQNNTQKLNNLNILNLVQKLSEKVITTNYDDILLINKSEQEKNFITSFWSNDTNFLESEQFYISLHGSIVEEYFKENNKSNIWEAEGNTFSIIDSLTSFVNCYMVEESKVNIFLKKLIKRLFKKEENLIFFGYSFNDYLLGKKLIEEVDMYTYKNKPFEKKFTIFQDDIDHYLKNTYLNKSLGSDRSVSLLERDYIGYVFFSDIIELKNAIFDSESINLFNDKLTLKKSINGKLLSFEKKIESYDIVDKNKFLSNFLDNLKEFDDLKKLFYNNIIEDIFCIIDKNMYKEKIKQLYQYINKNIIDNFYKKIYKDTCIYEICDYDYLELFFKYSIKKDEIDKKNYALFLYSIIEVYKMELNEKNEVIEEFFNHIDYIDCLKELNNYAIKFIKFKKFIVDNYSGVSIKIKEWGQKKDDQNI
ncbi:hypothetical protein STURON_00981 [Spiroplasma turonicum]|uniref:Uncharacterized protein n=2 Tax=Spiroplasma turonicum TaxID=216946 RepID=A0A0K1P8J6_9MOLU|nr:hypothetical protein STURON_00981 [Spiroplasma turonicum]